MNICENYYCSRCMKQMEESEVCPYCGYDFEEEQDQQTLEQGVLLYNGRYELGAVIQKNQNSICYAAWDYYANTPVKIAEYFPQRIADRNNQESDTVLFREENTQQYHLGMMLFQVQTEGRYFKQHNTLYCVYDFEI